MPSHHDLAADLVGALSDGQIFAVFQPQVSLATGDVVAAEALCRWQHPRLGLIPPDEFIPVAEESGVIDDIGLFMLSEAVRSAEEWYAAGRALEVSVNVSPVQLASEAFFAEVAAAVRRFGERQVLTIEITESMPVVDIDTVLPRLQDLRTRGVGVSLDDFGSGHASLEQIENLPLTELKIDGRLIRDAHNRSLEPLAEIVDLAHERGIRLVAEGIETPTHLRTAVSLGCDRAQGYLLGRPGPANRLVAP